MNFLTILTLPVSEHNFTETWQAYQYVFKSWALENLYHAAVLI